MDAPEGQDSIDALNLVFDALEHAGVDARRRKIIWDDGEAAVDQAVGGAHPCRASGRCPAIRSKIPLRLARKLRAGVLLEQQLEERPAVGPWIDDYQRTSRTTKK